MADQLPLIVHHLVPAIIVAEMIEVAIRLTGFAVPAMVIGRHIDPALIEKRRESLVASAVLGHTVHNMQP